MFRRYWEYFPSWEQRRLVAEGNTIIEETQTFANFSSRYFSHEDTEDLPGDDVFARYVTPRYQPQRLDVRVEDGTLNLHCESASTYACAVEGIVVFPTSEHEKGEAFLAELLERQKEAFDFEYVQAIYAATGPASTEDADSSLPLEVFHRNPDLSVRGFDRRAVAGTSTAGEDDESDIDLLKHPLRVALAVGETTQITFSLWSRNTSLIITAVEASIAGIEAAPFLIRNKIARLSEGVYTARPLLLDPSPSRLPLSLPAGRTQRVWLRATAKESGCQNGTVRVRFVDGSELRVAVVATVANFTLEVVPQSLPVGFLGSAPIISSTPFPESQVLAEVAFSAAVDSLHELGATGITGGLGGPLVRGYDSETGDLVVEFDAADNSMAEFNRLWPQAAGSSSEQLLNTYGGLQVGGVPMLSSTWSAASGGDVFGKPYTEVLHDALGAIAQHAAESNGLWRPLYHVLGDEPSDETALRVMEVAEAFKSSGVEALSTVFTSITSNTSIKVGFADNVDLVILNHHSEEAILALQARNPSVKWMLYNQHSRYRVGFCTCTICTRTALLSICSCAF